MINKTLTSLEKIKDFKLDEQKIKLQNANLKLKSIIDKHEETLNKVIEQKELIAQNQTFSLNFDAWREAINIKLNKQKEAIKDAKEEVLALEILLHSAWQDKKSISILIERISKRQQLAQNKLESLALDEFSIIKFANSKISNS